MVSKITIAAGFVGLLTISGCDSGNEVVTPTANVIKPLKMATEGSSAKAPATTEAVAKP